MPEEENVVVTPVLAPGRYGEMVAAAKDYISAGDIFQVVLAQRFTAPFPLPPLALDRKSVVSGQSVSVLVDLGGRRILTKKYSQFYSLHFFFFIIISFKFFLS